MLPPTYQYTYVNTKTIVIILMTPDFQEPSYSIAAV
jgi:hypothetical protein